MAWLDWEVLNRSGVIITNISLIALLYGLFRWLRRFQGRKIAIRGLAPDYPRDDVKAHLRDFVPSRYEEQTPLEPQTDQPGERPPKLIPYFMKQGLKKDDSEHRFHLILGEAGMGKTTFLINLYMRYARRWFIRLYIAYFDEKAIRTYLNKKYPINFRKRGRAMRVVMQSPRVMMRPMVLSYIEELLASGRTFTLAYQIFDEITASWMEAESQKPMFDTKPKRKTFPS